MRLFFFLFSACTCKGEISSHRELLSVLGVAVVPEGKASVSC